MRPQTSWSRHLAAVSAERASVVCGGALGSRAPVDRYTRTTEPPTTRALRRWIDEAIVSRCVSWDR